MRASTNSLELCWVNTPTAHYYLLECMKIEPGPLSPTTPTSSSIQQSPSTATTSAIGSGAGGIKISGSNSAAENASILSGVTSGLPMTDLTPANKCKFFLVLFFFCV